MSRRHLILIALCLAGALAGFNLFRQSLGVTDRGMAGMEFVIPSEYTLLRIEEADLASVCGRLLEMVDTDPRIAVEFGDRGSTVQILVDVAGDLIDEREAGRQGTVSRVLWPGPVRERLRWARDHGTLEAPDLPPPERRNPYH